MKKIFTGISVIIGILSLIALMSLGGPTVPTAPTSAALLAVILAPFAAIFLLVGMIWLSKEPKEIYPWIIIGCTLPLTARVAYEFLK